MAAPFPATPSSPSYATVAPSTRCGIYYGPSPSPSFTLSESGSATYQVLNWQGVQVSSGSVSGTTVAPAAPSGGWLYGWYRLYLYDGSSESSGACNFCVIRTNANFVTNPPAGTPGDPGSEGVDNDEVTRGVFVIGPERYAIDNVFAPSPSLAQILLSAGTGGAETYYLGILDSNRPRPLHAAFTTQAVDHLSLSNGTNTSVNIYCKTAALNGSLLTIAVAAGSVSGFKVTVAYNGSTVETYDNQATSGAFVTAANTASAYIFVAGESGGTPVDISATAIGNAYSTAVTAAVAELYPTITWFEGPTNEPNFTNDTNVLEVAHQMLLFHAAVKAGAADALVMGPAVVNASYGVTKAGGPWDTYLGALVTAGTPCDAISWHAYNQLLGDLNMMRSNLGQLTALFTKHDLDLPLWQTEQGVYTPVYSVYHPRRARWTMLQLLLQESYGIPKEQNYLFYDGSHGFWSIPAWWENANTGLNPQAVMIRTYSEEVFGCNFDSNISFGSIGDKMYFGGYWQNPSTGVGVAIFMSPSPILGSTQQVILNVTGTTSPLTVVDCWGNSSTVTPVSGLITLPITDTPIYVQLPNGVSLSGYTFGTWLPLTVSDMALEYPQTSSEAVANGIWENGYDGNGAAAGGAGPVSYLYSAEPPETGTEISFERSYTFNRVVIWCGMVWQKAGTLTDFDLQTSPDGSTWTTQATLTNPPPTTIPFVTSGNDVGCTLETYWEEPWIFDIPFSPVTAQYIRLNTRSASYGGEPDASCVAAGGQGTTPETYAIEEIGVFYNDIILFPITLS